MTCRCGGLLHRATGLACLIVAGCGGSPVKPAPPLNGGGDQQLPANNAPVIESIGIQGFRPREPGNFADPGESIGVVATVHDEETPPDRLTYEWSATAGAFSGAGASTTWTAPAVVTRPTDVGITVKVVERYGPSSAPEQRHEVTGTAAVSLHDSIKEVGEMSRQFLLEFSDSRMRDIAYIMRNFSRTRCPEPREVDDETEQVAGNRINFWIWNFRIGMPAVTVDFGGRCPFRGKMGDACAVVPSYWDSTDLRDGTRGGIDGNDIIAAAYAPQDSRWWLCASDYNGKPVFGATLRGFIR